MATHYINSAHSSKLVQLVIRGFDMITLQLSTTNIDQQS